MFFLFVFYMLMKTSSFFSIDMFSSFYQIKNVSKIYFKLITKKLMIQSQFSTYFPLIVYNVF